MAILSSHVEGVFDKGWVLLRIKDDFLCSERYRNKWRFSEIRDRCSASKVWRRACAAVDAVQPAATDCRQSSELWLAWLLSGVRDFLSKAIAICANGASKHIHRSDRATKTINMVPENRRQATVLADLQPIWLAKQRLLDKGRNAATSRKDIASQTRLSSDLGPFKQPGS